MPFVWCDSNDVWVIDPREYTYSMQWRMSYFDQKKNELSNDKKIYAMCIVLEYSTISI